MNVLLNNMFLQIKHPTDPTRCQMCKQGTIPDFNHIKCIDIPEEYLRHDSAWAMGAMSFSTIGILVTVFVLTTFFKYSETPVVRASGRELSYVLLAGILMCYGITYALVVKPTDIVCGIQRSVRDFTKINENILIVVQVQHYRIKLKERAKVFHM